MSLFGAQTQIQPNVEKEEKQSSQNVPVSGANQNLSTVLTEEDP